MLGVITFRQKFVAMNSGGGGVGVETALEDVGVAGSGVGEGSLGVGVAAAGVENAPDND